MTTPPAMDGSGNSLDAYTYDVFGAIRSQSGTSGSYWMYLDATHIRSTGSSSAALRFDASAAT